MRVTELRECPNPECKVPEGPGVTSTHVRLERLQHGDDEWHARCAFCFTRGPRAIGKAEAIRLWNALPRQSDLEQLRARIAELDPPWVRIGDGLPQDPYSWDIALRDGSVRTNLAWDRYYEFFHDGGPNAWTSAEVSHYRRYALDETRAERIARYARMWLRGDVTLEQAMAKVKR
jgi:hypothetical protein